MTRVRVPELATLFARPPRPVAPKVEDGLRAAAATLCHALPALITSTTVVVDIGPDDLDALERLVHDIIETRAMQAAIRPHVGWCAVRFSRRLAPSG
jgi:hypothetical protein